MTDMTFRLIASSECAAVHATDFVVKAELAGQLTSLSLLLRCERKVVSSFAALNRKHAAALPALALPAPT